MNQARPNVFDATIGVRDERTWLDKQLLRRELTADQKREALDRRSQKASEAAESFRERMNSRAELRSGIEKKSEEIRKQQLELMQRKADEYRERLRNKLRPEVRD